MLIYIVRIYKRLMK